MTYLDTRKAVLAATVMAAVLASVAPSHACDVGVSCTTTFPPGQPPTTSCTVTVTCHK